ncbi:putative RNA methyltransferase [Nonomuraea sp. ATR24]|uniref:putative RNA methyltransferase n=1 Tax=Nonomuraea TaxID=83681 RepID=UPI001C6072D4|nr:methyltransferase domain-containing protein [Nonomuraea ceibae]
MLADIVGHLACPVCREPVRLDADALRCARGHSFDVAKQGYVSLLVGSRPPGTADSAEMVAARSSFLEAGHYAPLARALGGSVLSHTESFSHLPDGEAAKAYGSAEMGSGPAPQALADRPVIVDAGAGTGYYLSAVLTAAGRGVGMAFDVSKHAVRRAARAHPRAGAFVADVWRTLPIRDGAADVVINVFAPRNGPEFRRILRPGGAVVVVTPTGDHLSPLVEELGLLSVDADKERRVARSLEGFTETARQEVAFEMELGPADVLQVVGMGPSAWHTGTAELEERISSYFSPRVTKKRGKVVVKAAFSLSTFEVTPYARPVP